jgi:hypothetical protein
MTKFHQRLAAAFRFPVEQYELVGTSEGESARVQKELRRAKVVINAVNVA